MWLTLNAGTVTCSGAPKMAQVTGKDLGRWTDESHHQEVVQAAQPHARSFRAREDDDQEVELNIMVDSLLATILLVD